MISSISNSGFEFEKIVEEILSQYGFDVSVDNQTMHDYDICAEFSGSKFAIEVKISRDKIAHSDIILRAVDRVRKAALKDNRRPVIVTANLIGPRLEEKVKGYNDLIIIDIQNLLFLLKDNEVLKSKLLSILSFSVDDILPLKPEELLKDNLVKPVVKDIPYKYLIKNIEEWEPDGKNNLEYEKLCSEVLQYLFDDDLALWKEQRKSNDDLFRFDLICKVKDANDKEFWKMAEKHFSTKYIIFEFKNYTGKITQKEIFTTEKYLYIKALRGIAIIISNNGADKNANKAIKGTLRENGKLIISLTNKDLIEMLKMKAQNEKPADYLSTKLDNILIELEK